MPKGKVLSTVQREKLLGVLQARFEANGRRHPGLAWPAIQARLEDHPEALWSLQEMELTGGEPDVVLLARDKGNPCFVDCSAESPAGRRSLCYDRVSLESRKEHKPKTSVLDMATAMGVELLSEGDYRDLQKLGEFDLKTSSWLTTPDDIRGLGGALFADRRYGHVFVYHNGAESYYAARGFRALLRI